MIDQENSEISETSERRASEINAAIKSLETNIFLCFIGVVAFSVGTFCNDQMAVVILILIKGLTPIITTIANFEKIYELVLLFWEILLDYFVKR